MNLVHRDVLADAMALSKLHDELADRLHGLDATLAGSIRELEILYLSHYERLMQHPTDDEVVVRAHQLLTRRLELLIAHAKEVKSLPVEQLWKV